MAAFAVQCRDSVSQMESMVWEHGWDGAWFLRAYDAFGEKVGSQGCEEGQIFIEPQAWSIMSGVATTASNSSQPS